MQFLEEGTCDLVLQTWLFEKDEVLINIFTVTMKNKMDNSFFLWNITVNIIVKIIHALFL